MPRDDPADLETRLRLLEAELKVNELRMDQLEDWRRRDEPRIAELATAAQVAREVRAALRERGRHEWSRLQKILAVVGGAAVTIPAIQSLYQLFH